MGRSQKNNRIEKEQEDTQNVGNKTSVVDTLQDDKKVKVKKMPKDLPNYVQLKVKSNIGGLLYFKNKRNGNSVTWSKKDEIQFLSVEDIKHIKADQNRFFEENWISIVGVVDEDYSYLSIEDIYALLTLQAYFKVTKLADKFDKYISSSKSKLKSFIDSLTDKEKELFKNYIETLSEYKKDSLTHGVIVLLTNELGVSFDG